MAQVLMADLTEFYREEDGDASDEERGHFKPC